MNKKLLKQLLTISYKNGKLDSETVAKIADKLDRSQLKQYISALKNAEKLQNVYIETPFSDSKKTVENFKDLFPQKNIQHVQNSSLLVGARINYNDDVFEISLKNNLDEILKNIEHDYD